MRVRCVLSESSESVEPSTSNAFFLTTEDLAGRRVSELCFTSSHDPRKPLPFLRPKTTRYAAPQVR